MFDLAQLQQDHGIPKILGQSQKVNDLCPVARVNVEFSPERIARMAGQDPQTLLQSTMIWECLACGLCREATEGQTDMSRFIRSVRQEAIRSGYTGFETHEGIFLSAQRIEAGARFESNHNAWISEDEGLLVKRQKGEYLYWVGGAPFFAAALPDLKPTSIDSSRAAIRLLNRLGIQPVVLQQERFSGHDLLWTGNLEGFHQLARRNIQAIRESGAKTVIVSSPEDCYTLKVSYRELAGGLEAEVRHLSEVAAERLSLLRFAEWPHRVTYHDPCRLGRGMGIYEAPREVLKAIPALELVEMEHSRQLARCCGTSCWTNCTGYSKQMQVNRLQEAVDCGAEALITPCWECALHFRCATRAEAWRQVSMDVRDWTELVAALLRE